MTLEPILFGTAATLSTLAGGLLAEPYGRANDRKWVLAVLTSQ